ncbi:MAG: hypothetical protein AAF927_10755 [Bacteroidota bacterium]
MRKRILFSVLVVTMLIATGCRKYPDGPTISFIPKVDRISQNWIVDQIYRNDIEETDQYDVYGMNITKGGRLTWTVDFRDIDPVIITGDWELASVKEQIKITFDEKDPVSGETRLLYMDILRLTQDQLWLNFLTDGDYYLVRLRPA